MWPDAPGDGNGLDAFEQADTIFTPGTGRFTAAGAARAHLDAGAGRVLISAPSDGTVLPRLQGRLSGDSIRVPVPVG